MPSGVRSWLGHAAVSSAGPSGDVEENRALLQDRIALFGKVGCGVVLALYVLIFIADALSPSARVWVPVAGVGRGEGSLTLGTASVLAIAWLLCRHGRRSPEALLLIDAGVSFLACLGASLPVLLPEATTDHKYRMLLAITNALIARAAVIPTRPTRTFAVSALAAAPAVWLTHGFHAAPGRYEGPLDVTLQTIVSTLWCAIAVGIATITSRVIYGLHRRVREARQLGQYTLLEKLGEGGMGEVYRARHALLRRPTAVKLLPPEKAGEARLQRFEREVQLSSILTHPNTVSVFDYGHTADGVFYYAMEYLEGVNLEELVVEDGPQPPARVVRILQQVCGALSEAHGIGLIHRDVKPANIILCERGGIPDVAKIFDYGLVRDLHADESQALTNDRVIGTPLYLSPEAITSPETVDGRSDLYALGAVAYYLLAGRQVFEGRTLVEVCSHHLHTPPQPPSQRLGRALPRDLEAVVLSCLEKEPDRRPSSAQDLYDRLAACPGLGTWSEEDARAWWGRRRGRKRSEAAGRQAEGGTLDRTQALTVDLEGRQAKQS